MMEIVIKADNGYKVRLKSGDFPIIAWSIACKQAGGSYLNSIVIPIIPLFDLGNNDDNVDLLCEISHADIICPDESVIDKDSLLMRCDSSIDDKNELIVDPTITYMKDLSQTEIVMEHLNMFGYITVSEMKDHGIKSPSSCMSKLKKEGIKFTKSGNSYVLSK